MTALTPVERRDGIWFKRDDLFSIAGVQGGKVRTCWTLAHGARGLITAGSRASPQINIVAHIAAALGIPCRAHAPSGTLSDELLDAERVGAVIVQHRPGYNTVICARAHADAQVRGWREIPFGMECRAAVDATADEVDNLPAGIERLVVPVGSGMSLAGIITGLARRRRRLPILGVCVGAAPDRRLDRFARGWRGWPLRLIRSPIDYHKPAPVTVFAGLPLDPIYEAKCLGELRPGDALWIVGIRRTAVAAVQSAG